MLPWNNKFLKNQGSIKPKTIICGSDGQDIKTVAREIAKSFISSVDGKDYSNFELENIACLLYTSPSPRDTDLSRMPSSA